MSILQQKFQLPNDLIKIERGEKVLFLNPSSPDWIVVSKNAAAILQLCNGKRTVEDISDSLSRFWRKGSKTQIIKFFESIISDTTFLSPPSTPQVYQPNALRIIQLSLISVHPERLNSLN
jgi:hypothetical protein